jgi:hypothetical protein
MNKRLIKMMSVIGDISAALFALLVWGSCLAIASGIFGIALQFLWGVIVGN